MIKVYVIGINFDNPDFELIFDVLDEGIEFGVEYKRIPWINVKNEKEVSDGDAYIYLEMQPIERISKDKLTLRVSQHDDYDAIDARLGTFVTNLLLIGDKFLTITPEDTEELPPWDCDSVLTPEEIIQGRIREVVVKIKDKTVKLNPGDLALLVKVDKFLKDNGYIIEEIIV